MAGTWTHRDDALPEHLESGHNRSRVGDWQSGPLSSRVDAFRAVVADTAAAMAWFVGTTRLVNSETGAKAIYVVSPQTGTPRDRVAVAGRLYATFKVFQVTNDGGIDGDIVTTAQTESAGFLAGVAIVAVVAFGAAALGFAAHEAAIVVDRQLARNEDTRRMMQAHVKVLELVHQHQQREEQAGKSLPVDAATQQALAALGQQQSAIIAKREEPFPSPWPKSTNPLDGVSGTALVAAAIAGYFLLREQT